MSDNTFDSEQVQLKKCNKCKEEKSKTEFHADRCSKDGLRAYCKPCAIERTRKWRQSHPEQYRAYNKKWRQDNLERARELDRKWQQVNSCRVHARRILKAYGISKEDYDSLLDHQKGVCAICGKSCKTGRRLAVDHDHSTGEIRGLLCLECNKNLGVVESFMEQALEYLNRKR